MDSRIKTDVVVIGGGPVGLFSIFQAGMLGMKVNLFDALETLGGQCTALYPKKPIYDIPGHPCIAAEALVKSLIDQAAPFRPVYHLGDMVSELTQERDKWLIKTQSGIECESSVVLIAAGNGSFVPNKPDIKGIDSFELSGSVAYCVKDYSHFDGQVVLIAGGGDSAVDWVNILSGVAKKIFLVHRREKFRCAEESLQKMLKFVDAGIVEICAPYQVYDIMGKGGVVEAVDIASIKEGEVRRLAVDKVLCCFGLKSRLGPIENWGLSVDKGKVMVSYPTCMTNLPGVYAVGDIALYEHKLKLILTGFAEVSFALHDAYAKVFPEKTLRFQYSTTQGVPN
ncbi:NAD(P)/FAD-dependent oxidoreductase [Candidatus Sneabacter namystus]|uniref:Ferredoxin--NADP reductase n=1 Tax=Candidatus Sneabacter namystus TaxID=2601646 RepID=A0A5C0UJB8_9RICK|nr:NAD(P)/FAD-dependent oxidoreductase [Candidatus Sneabacter namystus]QEK39850.1 NAD(P)/FAD-dependent oxidoreductase [Candidatus Sneabacter namystus]